MKENIFPKSTNTEDTYIIGIDPGTQFVGFASLNINLESLLINDIHAETIILKNLIDSSNHIIEIHGERTAKLIKLKEELIKRYEYYNPITICCEAPFYNYLTPSAYRPLVEATTYIRLSAIEYLNNIPFIFYEPSLIKKLNGAYAFKGKEKEKIQQAIFNNKELYSLLNLYKKTYDNNAIDAIAVAYSHLVLAREKS